MRQEKRTYQKFMTILALLLVIALTGFIVAGCGGSAEKKEGVEKKEGSESTEKQGGEATEGEGERSEQAKAQESRVSDETDPAVLYVQNCGACHGHDGSGVVGPAIKGTALAVEQVRAKIDNGGGQMPAFKDGELSEKQIGIIASYVKSNLK